MHNFYKIQCCFRVKRPKGKGKERKNKTQEVEVWRILTIHRIGKKEEWNRV